MATNVLDETRFKNQCSLYDSNHVQLLKDSLHNPTTTTTTTTVLNPSSIAATNHNGHAKYSMQTNILSSHSLSHSIHRRHSGSSDIFTIIRSFTMKSFKASSMTNAIAGGETSNVIGGSSLRNKSSVSLLRIRPLSDVLTEHAPHTQSHRAIEEFLKHMDWPTNSTTDEQRVKWNTAVKFLIPTKHNVFHAIDLYKTHENLRKTEKLDHIWIKNPHLIQEIESGKFFSLPQKPNQPLPIIFTASNLEYLPFNTSLTHQDHELLTLQALICQLDVATENIEVQQNGLNFIYDMQNCSASQFNINLSKKILKLLQGGYPAMLKNIFVISAPKWFRVVYKVTFYSIDQIREYLTSQYGYSSDNIPVSFGGSYDPMRSGTIRYQICLSKVTNPQSICYPYYSLNCQFMSTKSTNDNLFNQDKSFGSTKALATPSSSSFSSSSSSSSTLRLVSARHNNHESSSSQTRVGKRESSSSSDNEKRQRSNENLIVEELSASKHTHLMRKKNHSNSLKRNENGLHLHADRHDKNGYHVRNSMIENEYRENKCDIKQLTTNNLYKILNETEFLSKSKDEIKKEFHTILYPPAQDTRVAKYAENIDKSRYRDVIPGESTRVKLQEDLDDKNEFINANYVSGYNNQKKAYIFTQGPLQSTVKDFWRMIWQENISIIVMTTNICESGTIKCYPYWPLRTGECLESGSYEIKNERIDSYDSFNVTLLSLKKKNEDEVRTVYHAHYLKWPDHGIPTGTKDALLFLEKVEYYKQLTMTNAPILLHCSAGIGRTGTFCAIDIGIKRYLKEKAIDIPSTVLQMRYERAGSVQTEDQYLFAHLALMDFIKQHNKINQEKVPSLDLTNSKISFELDRTITSSSTNGSNQLIIEESVPDQDKASSDSLLAIVEQIIASAIGANEEPI